jgi:hypothetical protein
METDLNVPSRSPRLTNLIYYAVILIEMRNSHERAVTVGQAVGGRSFRHDDRRADHRMETPPHHPAAEESAS